MNNLILEGPRLDVSLIDKGLGEYFFEQAELYGNKLFQIDAYNEYTETYLVTKQRSTRVAVNLQKMGIKQKDVIMICCRNNASNIIPALAALYIGAYVSSVDSMQSVTEIKRALGIVEPKIIFVEENSLPLIKNSLEDTHINAEIVIIGKSDIYASMDNMEKQTAEESSFKPIKQKGSDIAAILFSSGTTSAPKGIMLSNSYFLNGSQALLLREKRKVVGVNLHFASLYWVSSWISIGMAVVTGSAKLVAQGINGERFLQLIDKYKVTNFFTSTTFTYEITKLSEDVMKKYNTSSLHGITIGGSAIEPQQLLKLRKALPYTNVALGYGSTEGNIMVYHDFDNQKAYQEKPSSSGTVLPGVQLKVLDLETGKPLGPNQEGEIYVKSSVVMSGYYKFDKPDTFDKDGFYKTGDVGYYDKDEYVYIIDRIGDMFKYKQNQISPSIIENVLLTHPAIYEAVVFGVFHATDRNRPAACVVLKKEISTTVKELLEFVKCKVPDSYQLRGGIMIVDSIPKTPSGKTQKRVVRDIFVKAKDT